MPKRVLVSTIASRNGGVAGMLQFVLGCLDERGFEPVVAFYKPHSEAPELSVPIYRLLQRKVGSRTEPWLAGKRAKVIGAWLPELEFTHYQPTRQWRELIGDCDFHLSVSGNCLAATAFMKCGKPYLAWVATPWHEDRKDRVAKFPWYRKLLDRFFNSRVIARLERKILEHGNILALSDYTRKSLDALAGRVSAVLPMPVDIHAFTPDPERVEAGRIGFSGRFTDPRKNVPLLLDALALARKEGVPLILELIGDDANPAIARMIRDAGLEDAVVITPHLDRPALAERLRRLDLFVIGSHQEGLCIAALEAMASGCPVVSTRCGGPEEFVLDGETGYCVDFDASAMAKAICRVVRDRALRARLAMGARATVESRYRAEVAKEVFWRAFVATFPTAAFADDDEGRTS